MCALLAVLATPAVASTPLACQSLEHAGLSWEGGRWKVSRFQPVRFILVLEGDTLTPESAGKAMNTSLGICQSGAAHISCRDPYGGSLWFNRTALVGGVSQLFGAGSTGAQRDTPAVMAFECQKF